MLAVEGNWHVKVKISAANSEEDYQNLRSGVLAPCDRLVQIVCIATRRQKPEVRKNECRISISQISLLTGLGIVYVACN
jgi:hypothetical protein